MEEEWINSKVYIWMKNTKTKMKKNEQRRVEVLSSNQIKIYYSATLDKVYDFDHVFYSESNKI